MLIGLPRNPQSEARGILMDVRETDMNRISLPTYRIFRGTFFHPAGVDESLLDVARPVKVDQTVFAVAHGDVITRLESSSQPDLMAAVGRTSRLIEELRPILSHAHPVLRSPECQIQDDGNPSDTVRRTLLATRNLLIFRARFPGDTVPTAASLCRGFPGNGRARDYSRSK